MDTVCSCLLVTKDLIEKHAFRGVSFCLKDVVFFNVLEAQTALAKVILKVRVPWALLSPSLLGRGKVLSPETTKLVILGKNQLPAVWDHLVAVIGILHWGACTQSHFISYNSGR